MTLKELSIAFEAGDEYMEFDRVQNKRSNRPDLHALMLLDSLIPGDEDIISAATHDEIWLGINAEELAAAATP